jgi:hypothetical protein
MTRLLALMWSQLRQRLADLRALFLLGIAITGIVAWLAPPPGQWPLPDVVGWLASLSGKWPRPAAEHKLVAPPLEISARVTHIWLPEPLVNLAKRECWSALPRRHEQVRNILADEEGHGFFYAFTRQLGYANGSVEYMDYIRYSIREPQKLQELVDVMAVVAGNPPPYRTTEFSNALVHVVPAGTSRRELLHEIEAESLSRKAGMRSR